MSTSAPLACAAAAMAATSCISKLSEPGDSRIDGARIRLHQAGDRGADQRIVIGGGDAEPGEDLVAKSARRSVGAVGDEDMVAGMHDRQQGRRNCRKARRQQRHTGALRPFELLQREFERLGRRRAAPSVLIARAVGEVILGARIKHGRGVIDRRIDEAVIGGGIAAGGDHARVRVSCLGGPSLLSRFHGRVSRHPLRRGAKSRSGCR